MCSRVLRRRLRGALAQAPSPHLFLRGIYCGEDGKHWIEVEWLCIWPTNNEFTT